MGTPRRLVASLLPWLVAGCSLFAGFGHMQPVEVSSYFPSAPFVEAADIPWVRVSFSSPMNRARTEEAFRLSEDEQPRTGSFGWDDDGRTLRFFPSSPLEPAKAYTVSVSTAAEDAYGNSLARPLAVRFVTGTEGDRPRITDHSPGDGATVADLREPVRVRFSEPPQPASVLSGFSIEPEVRGSFAWSGDETEITFQPLEDYTPGRPYTVRLAEEIRDRSGNPLVEGVEFRFLTAARPRPAVLSVLCPRSGRTLSPDGVDLSLGIEKDETFLVTFSAPVLPSERERAVSLLPAAATLVSWNAEGDGCQVGFREPLQWGGSYSLCVLEESFGFVVNGEHSLPPQVTSIRYCPELGAAAFVELQFAGNYSFLSAGAPVFDFHLRHAVDAVIDLGSFLKALSIEAGGGCLTLQCLHVALSPFPVDPDPLPGPGQSVVRLACSIVDDPLACGVLSIRLDTDLGDNLGNHLAAPHVLVVNNSPD